MQREGRAVTACVQTWYRRHYAHGALLRKLQPKDTACNVFKRTISTLMRLSHERYRSVLATRSTVAGDAGDKLAAILMPGTIAHTSAIDLKAELACSVLRFLLQNLDCNRLAFATIADQSRARRKRDRHIHLRSEYDCIPSLGKRRVHYKPRSFNRSMLENVEWARLLRSRGDTEGGMHGVQLSAKDPGRLGRVTNAVAIVD